MTVTVKGAPHQGDGEIHAPNTIEAATDDPKPDSPSALADATDGSLAGRMLAQAAKVENATERFPMPGWADEDGEPTLVLVAKQTKGRIKGKVTNEQFIIGSTVDLLFLDEDTGKLEPMPDGWAGVALKMNASGTQHSTGDAVRKVLSNPLRLDLFAAELLAWNAGRRDATEQALGE